MRGIIRVIGDSHDIQDRLGSQHSVRDISKQHESALVLLYGSDVAGPHLQAATVSLYQHSSFNMFLLRTNKEGTFHYYFYIQSYNTQTSHSYIMSGNTSAVKS